MDSEKKWISHHGYLWAHRDVLNNPVLFDYQHGRNKESASQMLQDFKGFLQIYGYIA